MKRRTKEQREAHARAALRQRIHDVACGAAGYQFDAEGELATADFLSCFVPALKEQFGYEEKDETERTAISIFFSRTTFTTSTNVDSTTDFLFYNKVRA